MFKKKFCQSDKNTYFCIQNNTSFYIMNIPQNLKYTQDDEWVRVEGEFAFIGITDYAQHELGDIVFVDVACEGDTINAGEVFGSVEAVKTVADLLMPIEGEVIEFNTALEDASAINSDPYGAGWIIKVKPANMADIDALMDAAAYTAKIGA